jgi:hypothetical protein
MHFGACPLGLGDRRRWLLDAKHCSRLFDFSGVCAPDKTAFLIDGGEERASRQGNFAPFHRRIVRPGSSGERTTALRYMTLRRRRCSCRRICGFRVDSQFNRRAPRSGSTSDCCGPCSEIRRGRSWLSEGARRGKRKELKPIPADRSVARPQNELQWMFNAAAASFC